MHASLPVGIAGLLVGMAGLPVGIAGLLVGMAGSPLHLAPPEGGAASPSAPPAPVAGQAVAREPDALFDLLPYGDWRVVGGAARFELLPPANGGVGPTLVGRGPIDRNGFLTSPRALGDFRLVVDVRLGSSTNPTGEKMNSGIQIRSGEKGGAIGGMQVEIDPTPRRWSGGIYDERGRLWLAPLEGNAAAQAAFRLGEWNTYEIECIGPRIRTRVNGVACAQWFDEIVEGLLAFQVHGGPECEVAFRAPAIEEIGRHAWRELREDSAASSGERVAWSGSIGADATGVRLEVRGACRIELLDREGRRLAEVPCAPIETVRDAKGVESPASEELRARPRRVAIVWKDAATSEGTDGAALIDGARAAELALSSQPARMRVVGAGDVAKTEELAPVRGASTPSER
jgi:hypothetical protein